MKEVVPSITMNKAVGLVLGSVFIATCGFWTFAEAMPPGGVASDARLTMASQHGVGSDVGFLRLVDTRDHDEDASTDRSMTEMNNPKKKSDKPMKQVPGAKSRSGQGGEMDEDTSATGNPSAHSDEKIGKGIDRPDDRRQGQNLKRKP